MPSQNEEKKRRMEMACNKWSESMGIFDLFCVCFLSISICVTHLIVSSLSLVNIDTEVSG